MDARERASRIANDAANSAHYWYIKSQQEGTPADAAIMLQLHCGMLELADRFRGEPVTAPVDELEDLLA